MFSDADLLEQSSRFHFLIFLEGTAPRGMELRGVQVEWRGLTEDGARVWAVAHDRLVYDRAGNATFDRHIGPFNDDAQPFLFSRDEAIAIACTVVLPQLRDKYRAQVPTSEQPAHEAQRRR